MNIKNLNESFDTFFTPDKVEEPIQESSTEWVPVEYVYGRVVPNTFVFNHRGEVKNISTGNIMSPNSNKSDLWAEHVTLPTANGKRTSVAVNKLKDFFY